MVEVSDIGVMLNCSANVIATDIVCTNGVIHVIDFVLLPYATARRLMGASRDLDIQIQLLVDDIGRQDEVKERIRRVLRQEHGLKPGQPDDFRVQTPEQLTESFNTVINAITAVMAGIVGMAAAWIRAALSFTVTSPRSR